MANINIDKTDVEYAKNFLIQYLRDSGYEGTLEDGTAVYDLLIKPFSLLYTLFKSEVDRASAYLSIQKAQELKDTLGDEYDKVVDLILGNWFTERRQGKPSIGVIRCYFTKPLDYFLFNNKTARFKINGVDFTPLDSYNITSADFSSVFSPLEGTSLYYYDLSVVSTTNTDVLVKQGDKVNAYINNVYFIRSEVIEDFTPGSSIESSEDYIERTKYVITTRELITSRAINTVLLDTFDGLQYVYVAGYGSDEQIRDLRTFDRVTVHVGNHADIYVFAELVQKVTKFTIDENKRVTLDILPVADVLRVTYKGEEVAFSIQNFNELYFATHEFTPTLQLIDTTNSIIPGDEVEVEYLTIPITKDIAEYVTSLDNTVINYYPVVRLPAPVRLDFNIAVKLDTSTTVLTTEEIIKEIKKKIIEYTSNIPKGDTFVISALISKIHKELSYVKEVKIPIQVTYTIRNWKNGELYSGVLDNEFALPDNLSVQQSKNTTKFYTNSDFINIEVIS